MVGSVLLQGGQQGSTVVVREGLEPKTKPGAETVEEIKVGTGRLTFTHVAVAAMLEEETAPKLKRCAWPGSGLLRLIEAGIGEVTKGPKPGLLAEPVTVDQVGEVVTDVPSEGIGHGLEVPGSDETQPVGWRVAWVSHAAILPDWRARWR